MIRTFKIIVILAFIFLGELVYAQQVQPVVELNTPETTPRVVRASQVIRLLPGFTATAGFVAKIVEEYVYDQVIGGAYNLNENRNWVASTSYDLSGRLTSSGIGYYNSLGKSTQNQSLDIKTGKIWASEVRYDEFGRPAFSSLSAPVDSLNYGYKSNFLTKENGSPFTRTDLANITDNSSDVQMSVQKNKVGWYYSENNDSEKYQDITNYPYSRTIYSTLNPGLPLKTLGGNKIKKTANASEEWLQSYSFDMPLTQELFYEFGKDYFPKREGIIEIEQKNAVSTTPIRDGYNLYTIEDVTNGCDNPEPRVQIRLIDNLRLVRGKIYKISYTTGVKYYRVNTVEFRFDRGGGDGLILERSSVPTPANEIPSSFIYGSLVDKHTYNCPLGKPYYIRGTKTVVRDVHGVESVVFKNSDGNVLAAARSGNEEDKTLQSNTVIAPIGKQKYVDIHIPVGCGGSVRLLNNLTYKGIPTSVEGIYLGSLRLTIYNLITEKKVYNNVDINLSSLFNLDPGMYRFSISDANAISYKYEPNNPDIGFNGNIPKLLDEKNTLGVEYKVNYYDYSLNYYDKAGRLTKSTQPLSKDLETTFKYNTLGQLLETERPDEGKANFKYRKDSQIRFSQNVEQKKVNEFSYINYDKYARPIESGVAGGIFADLNADVTSFKVRLNSKKEQQFTVYDETDPVGLNAALTRANLGTNATKYKQQFIAGNVSKTFTDNPKTNTTWYSYDIYGRVTWMVQDIEGLGVKTIDYEYDFAKGQVAKVYYQRYNTEEQFVHKYTYNIAGELFTVATSTDNNKFEEQGKYKYYETGALKRVEIAENVQGIDYIYNLNGQLKAINHPSTESNLDPGNDGSNGMARDLFGFAIDYYNGDYTRSNTPTPVTSNNSFYTNNQYNGNIKATRWANGSINNRKQASQLYTYNKNNWLTSASFGTANNNGVITPNVYNNYKVYGLEYDANGNIQKLNRNKDGDTNNGMDKMVYNYKTNKPNQLTHVNDTKNAGVHDLIDQNSNNYEYDDTGKLKKNNQDKLEYSYNTRGLVTQVLKEGKPQVRFYYDERGHRIRKESNFTGAYTDVTYYVRDASGKTISIVTPAFGKTTENPTIEQPIYGVNRLGVFNRKGNVESRAYQLTDHLGNIRLVVGKDAGGSIIIESATDFYPFGMPMPNRQIVNGEPYRYAFQGQEKDKETGKEAFQLRLWDARIGRWLSTDPARQYSSPYIGMGNNPITGIDNDGGIVVFPDIFQALRAMINLNFLFRKVFKLTIDAVYIEQYTYTNYKGEETIGFALKFNKSKEFEKMVADLSLNKEKDLILYSFGDVLEANTVIQGYLSPSTDKAATATPSLTKALWRDLGFKVNPLNEATTTTLSDSGGGAYNSYVFKVNKELPDSFTTTANFNIGSTILHELLWHISPMGKYWFKKTGTSSSLFRHIGVAQDANSHGNGNYQNTIITPRTFGPTNKSKKGKE